MARAIFSLFGRCRRRTQKHPKRLGAGFTIACSYSNDCSHPAEFTADVGVRCVLTGPQKYVTRIDGICFHQRWLHHHDTAMRAACYLPHVYAISAFTAGSLNQGKTANFDGVVRKSSYHQLASGLSTNLDVFHFIFFISGVLALRVLCVYIDKSRPPNSRPEARVAQHGHFLCDMARWYCCADSATSSRAHALSCAISRARRYFGPDRSLHLFGHHGYIESRRPL